VRMWTLAVVGKLEVDLLAVVSVMAGMYIYMPGCVVEKKVKPISKDLVSRDVHYM